MSTCSVAATLPAMEGLATSGDATTVMMTTMEDHEGPTPFVDAVDDEDEDETPTLVWYKLPIRVRAKTGEGGEKDAAVPTTKLVIVDWPALVEKVERRTYTPPHPSDMPSVCPRRLHGLRIASVRFLIGTRNRSPDDEKSTARTLTVARLLGWRAGKGGSRTHCPRVLVEGFTDEQLAAKDALRSNAMVEVVDSSYMPAYLPYEDADPDTCHAYEAGVTAAMRLLSGGGELEDEEEEEEASAATSTTTAMPAVTIDGPAKVSHGGNPANAGTGTVPRGTKRVSIEARPPPPRTEGSKVPAKDPSRERDGAAVTAPTQPASAPTAAAAQVQLLAGSMDNELTVPHTTNTTDMDRPVSTAQEVRLARPTATSDGRNSNEDSRNEGGTDTDEDSGSDDDDADRADDDRADGSDNAGQRDGKKNTTYVPPLFGPPILPHDTWKDVWRTLEFSCWNCRRVVKANGEEKVIYTKANRSSMMPGAVLNEDYFESLDKVKDFVREHYGWIGPDESQSAAAKETFAEVGRTAVGTPTGAATRPQDPAAPRLQEPGTPYSPPPASSPSSAGSSVVSADRYASFAEVWRRLKSRGWKFKKASNRLANWEYHPPPGTMPEGFFLEEPEAVVEFVRKRDAEKKRAKPTAAPIDSPLYVHNDEGARAKKQKKVTKKPTLSERLEKAASADKDPPRSVTNAGEPCVEAANDSASRNVGTSKGAKRSAASVPLKPRQVPTKKRRDLPKKRVDWWKVQPVPSDDQVEPILLKLGYYRDVAPTETNSWNLPKTWYDSFPRDEAVQFGALQQLRMFLACYGCPPNIARSIKKAEQETLERWLAFANVPVTSENSVQVFNDEGVVSNPDRSRLTELLSGHGFERVDGKIYLPGASPFLRKSRTKPEPLVHIFSANHEIEDHLRPYIRGSWAFVFTQHDSSNLGRRSKSTDLQTQRITHFQVTKWTSHDYYETLSLRLWAATSNQDLPVFTKWPSREELGAFFANDPSENSCQPPTPMKSGNSFVANSPQSSEEEDDQSSQTSQSSEGCSRSLWDSIWPVLEGKLGFHKVLNPERYTHAKFPDEHLLATPEDLAKYLCKHGIPDYGEKRKNIQSSLQQMLHQWIVRAYVPPGLEDRPLPSDEKCVFMLTMLGWQICSPRVFTPWADDARLNRIAGKDYFEDHDSLRLYLRSSEHLGIVDDSNPLGYKSKGKISQDDLDVLRLWASKVNLPLPKFGESAEMKSSKYSRRSGRSARDSSQDLASATVALLKNRNPAAKPTKDSQSTNATSTEDDTPDLERTDTIDLEDGRVVDEGGQVPAQIHEALSDDNETSTFVGAALLTQNCDEVGADAMDHVEFLSNYHRDFGLDSANLLTQYQPDSDHDSDIEGVDGFFSPNSNHSEN